VALENYTDAYKILDDGLKVNGDHPDLTALKKDITPQYEKAQKDAFNKMSKEERLKEEGNALFKASQFEEAIAVYTKAIDLMPHEYGKPLNPIAVSCYNNRAACYQQLGFYKKVTEDCSVVIEADPKNVKALLRRGLALENLEKYRSALSDIREVLAIDPTIEMANKAQHRIGQAVRQLKSGDV
jgi:stress-induced-phosphoprotein 1